MSTEDLHRLIDHYRERCQRLEALAKYVRVTDWEWAGGGSDVRIPGSHSRMASKVLGLPTTLPTGWPSYVERSERGAALRELGIEEGTEG